jgi:hypothetical protein
VIDFAHNTRIGVRGGCKEGNRGTRKYIGIHNGRSFSRGIIKPRTVNGTLILMSLSLFPAFQTDTKK